MTAAEFIQKWSDSTLRERQGSQEHFIDLCRLLGEPTPAEDDPTGERYCFERGAEKVGGGDGWADVWRKGCFGWEYKGKHKDLNAALRQLQAYALNLQNPPYLVVSDMERIIVHTNWTNTVSRRFEFALTDLLDPAKLHMLQAVFTGSEELKPRVSPQELTAKVAQRFGELSRRLQERKHDPRAVAHFLNRLVFCMFAEDAKLLPAELFTKTIKATARRPTAAHAQLTDLFDKMARPGDTFFGADLIRWFNGGLFDDATALPLEIADLELILRTAEEHDWSEIDPSVFGTLFEQALKATRERPALGAHYTDREKILKIVDPVITWPLMAEWEAVLAEAREDVEAMAAADANRKAVFEDAAEQMKADPGVAQAGEAKRRRRLTEVAKQRDAAYGRAQARIEAWLTRLADYRVLDPACGSGNFLYVALHALLDIERRAIVDAERLGVSGFVPRVDLKAVKGIELDSYAAELARLTLWIGYLQWMRKNAARPVEDPVLSTLDQIENRDALLNADGSEAEWPAADAIIGNPPFLGGKRMRAMLGDAYVDQLWSKYELRVPHFADFVCYWIAKSWAQLKQRPSTLSGLVATNSVRGGASREVLKPLADASQIFEAWADESWDVEGAAVRVSIVCFGNGNRGARLNGAEVPLIHADLTASSYDLTLAVRLTQNRGVCFEGGQKFGQFDVSGDVARSWLLEPTNANGQDNSKVLRLLLNAADLAQRPSDTWVVIFPDEMKEADAAYFERPFEHIRQHVLPERLRSSIDRNKKLWWLHHRSRPDFRKAVKDLRRYIATPVISKYRFFVWLPASSWPSNLIDAITRDDDVAFGILHSRSHQLWSLRLGTSLEDRPRYTPSTTFETFPFPEGLTPNIPAADYAADPRAIAIAEAARELNEKREAWLNPADLVVREPEVVPGYPDRLLPRDEEAAKVLKKRTLTELYNQRPAWLAMLHERLDAAVAAAYGWPADLSDEEILERLFALNQERAAAGR